MPRRGAFEQAKENPMYRRLLAFSLILIAVGALPRVLAYFQMPIRWPEQLSSFSLLPEPLRQWAVAYGSFDIVVLLGAVLLVIAAVLSVQNLWADYFQTRPIRTSEVLLEEARRIHNGAEPDEALLIAINNYQRALQEQSAQREAEGVARRWEQEDVSAVTRAVPAASPTPSVSVLALVTGRYSLVLRTAMRLRWSTRRRTIHPLAAAAAMVTAAEIASVRPLATSGIR